MGKTNDVYLGNPLLKRAHTESELTYEQIIELARCEQDPLYFASKYIQIVTLDHGLQPFTLYKFQEKMLRTFHDNRFTICKLPRQPLALDTVVPTPRGWSTIGKLKIGDIVFSSSGITTRIVAKSETYIDAQCYKFTFDCGESIVAESDHLWELYEDGERLILPSSQLFEKQGNYTLKRAELKGNNTKFPIDWDKEIKIISIEETDTVPVACIEVEDKTHMFLCGKNFIPQKNCGKSTTVVSFLIHSLIFNENHSIAILANKASTAKDLLARLAVSYENLPKWIQAGVKSWNKTSVELENGSKVMAASTSASAVRGGTYNIIFLDEFAFVPNQIASNFMNSVYPTITSGEESKVIIVSCVTKDTHLLTPKGYIKMGDLIHKDVKGAYFTKEYVVHGKDKFYKGEILVNSGRVPTNVLKTRAGLLECSEEHKLWAYRDGHYGYFKSSELNAGDFISIKYNQQIFGSVKADPDFTDLESFKDMFKWTKETVIKFLSGHFKNSNPIIHNNKIVYFAEDHRVIEPLQIILSNLGILSSYYKVNTNLFSLEITGCFAGKLNDLLHLNIGQKEFTNICDFIIDENDSHLAWVEIKEIRKSENEVFDVSLPDIDGDPWCHSVLYNNFLGHQTPNGMNLYYKMWDDAINGRNEYIPIEINWYDVPGRDEAWKESVIRNTSERSFEVEFKCSFLGTSNTLISGNKLGALKFNKPIRSNNSLDIYVEPVNNRVYVITVDVARGVNKDYSAFSVIDITEMPYMQVAKYRDNQIKPLMFPYVIKDVAETYNNAFVLCEVNDVGDQVATGLHDELEYDNMLMCSTSSRKGQVVGQNFSDKAAWGVKMQKNVKRIGCLNLKALIEEDKLFTNDLDTINELTTFISKGGSWEADDGKNDDLVTTLVIFAWLCTNQYFKDLQDQDLRKKIYDEKMSREQDDMLPFGFVELEVDGSAVDKDDDGNLWIPANPEKEAEDMASLWNYFF